MITRWKIFLLITMIGKNGKSDNINNAVILLIDSDFDLSRIKTIKKDFHYNQIISFDYNSHKNLNLENIEHKISDDFITQENTNEIQNYLYNFSKWYEEKPLQKFFMIEDLNIGQLFQEQFIDYMIKFLKNSSNLKKFMKNFLTHYFFHQELYMKLVKSFHLMFRKLTWIEKLAMILFMIKYV